MSEAVTLANCADEPIHIPGRIQSFGALVAVSNDWLIAHLSANFASFLRLSMKVEPGGKLGDLFTERAMATLRQRLQLLRGDVGAERIFEIDLTGSGELFDVAVHRSGRQIVIEVERAVPGDNQHLIALLRPMISGLEGLPNLGEVCDSAARQLRGLLGFDRVMVYRFHEDDSGEVFAEARDPRLESFLGLRYPASDIPAQARKLYIRNLLRIISDVGDPTVPIEPTLGPGGEPLDLSLSTLRAVSPIHIEYLHNMGVGASMSVSIVINGMLWGLFACHHYSPLVLPYSLRSTAELFAQMFALLVGQKVVDEERREAARGQALHDNLMSQIAEQGSLIENIDTILNLIASAIPYDGASAFVEGEYVRRGSAPNFAEFREIVPYLNTIPTSRVFASNALQGELPESRTFADRAVGAMIIPVSRRPRDYIILWRRELVQTVTWAGRPEKTVEYGPNGARLTPRKSFEAWREEVSGTSRAWTAAQQRSAESLRVTMLEVILRITDQSMRERERAQEQQELLIAELNHRVRNILNLIRGLVNQSRGSTSDIAQFSRMVDDRIQALARAHDMITRANWSTNSLKELIDAETRAYLEEKSDRVEVDGPDVNLAPEAYSVLALVIHELVTNSAKYGSLCDRHGKVRVTLSRAADSSLQIAWRESGGPPVNAPTRRGFGSTIVERSIPYELKGETEVRFELTGLEADLRIPARYVHEASEDTMNPQTSPAMEKVDMSGELPNRVLLLEDNIIIALDTEETLFALGVPDVVVASSNAQALSLIEEKAPDFALLDFHLGTESSEPTAEALDALGLPFAFATGYGELDKLSVKFAGRYPVLQKPYSKNDLHVAMLRGAAKPDD